MDILSRLRFDFRRTLPMILQTESAECGLACIAMVAGYLGNHVGLPELRRRFSVSSKGTTLLRILDIATRVGLEGRPLRIELDDLPQLKAPAILHWNLNHFVVLKRAGSTHAVIHDPAFGERRLKYSDVSKYFTGIAIELRATADFTQKPAAARVTLGMLTGPISDLWTELLRVLILSLTLQLALMLTPFYMQLTVDQALVSADRDLLTLLGVGFFLIMLFHVLIGALRSWVVSYVSTTISVQWNTNVLAHLLRLPLDYFEKRNLGDLISRMGAVQTIQRTLSSAFVEAIIDGIMASVTLFIMVVYNPMLALITIAATGIYVTVRYVAFTSMKNATEQQIIATARQHSHLIESILGIQSVKLGGREVLRRMGWQNLLVDTTNRELSLARLRIIFQSSNQLVFGIERIAVIWIGALLTLDNVFSVGMLIAYIAYKDQFAIRISTLVDRGVELRMLRLHADRLADIVLAPPDSVDSNSDSPVPSRAIIELKNVSFRYAEGEAWVINDCSFTIEEGESVAIVGPSGCGKTTLLKVLLGLLKPEEGKVLVDSHDINKISRGGYYSIVGTVMQNDQLFAGSISDNISFFDIELDQERVEKAARLAGIHDEILAMPMAYNTLIGDMGSTLSGGQQQRLVLARALYRKPKLLFLDEATSHLDVACERVVNKNINKLKITKVIVAHRPETISSVDRVLVMEGGQVTREYHPQSEQTLLRHD